MDSGCYAFGDRPTQAVKEETVMDSITLKNFRCFREEQSARLVPLTLLVGENSTGKTSFMAMVRALWDVCYRDRIPDFKEPPYEFGSFDQIVHHRGGAESGSDSFEAGFDFDGGNLGADAESQSYRFDVAFGKNGSAPVLRKIRLTCDDVWYEVRYQDQSQEIRFGTQGDAWVYTPHPDNRSDYAHDRVSFFFWHDRMLRNPEELINRSEPLTTQGPLKPTDEHLKRIEQLGEIFFGIGFHYAGNRPYAGAPVRSKPRRTYDPARPTPDPEGDSIPMYLAHLSYHEPHRWSRLKEKLEDFGKDAGLFDEIDIRRLGKRDSEPFQVQVRKFGRKLKGPRRNLIDVGYGVSQVLPVITELLREEENAPPIFLLQQPEVHLHPTAQAALGSLFCRVASLERRLIVETHSDYLLDRVRMDVRDGASDLKPEDVSILFFERDDLDVHIHSLGFDEEGNILGTPDSYGKFFMEETRRSLWKR